MNFNKQNSNDSHNKNKFSEACLILFMGIVIIGCTAKYTIHDNSTLKAIPMPPMVSLDKNRTLFQNADLKIISNRYDGSSFFGFMKIENLRDKDVVVKWDQAVFVDELRVANPLGLTRNSIIPAGTSAETHISVDQLSRGRKVPFLPHYEEGSFSAERKVFSDSESFCGCYTLGLYNLIALPFNYPAAKEEARKDVIVRYDLEQIAIDAYNGKQVMIRVPYEIGGDMKKVELRYQMVGKKQPYTVDGK